MTRSFIGSRFRKTTAEGSPAHWTGEVWPVDVGQWVSDVMPDGHLGVSRGRAGIDDLARAGGVVVSLDMEDPAIPYIDIRVGVYRSHRPRFIGHTAILDLEEAERVLEDLAKCIRIAKKAKGQWWKL